MTEHVKHYGRHNKSVCVCFTVSGVKWVFDYLLLIPELNVQSKKALPILYRLPIAHCFLIEYLNDLSVLTHTKKGSGKGFQVSCTRTR